MYRTLAMVLHNSLTHDHVRCVWSSTQQSPECREQSGHDHKHNSFWSGTHHTVDPPARRPPRRHFTSVSPRSLSTSFAHDPAAALGRLRTRQPVLAPSPPVISFAPSTMLCSPLQPNRATRPWPSVKEVELLRALVLGRALRAAERAAAAAKDLLARGLAHLVDRARTERGDALREG